MGFLSVLIVIGALLAGLPAFCADTPATDVATTTTTTTTTQIKILSSSSSSPAEVTTVTSTEVSPKPPFHWHYAAQGVDVTVDVASLDSTAGEVHNTAKAPQAKPAPAPNAPALPAGQMQLNPPALN